MCLDTIDETTYVDDEEEVFVYKCVAKVIVTRKPKATIVKGEL